MYNKKLFHTAVSSFRKAYIVNMIAIQCKFIV